MLTKHIIALQQTTHEYQENYVTPIQEIIEKAVVNAEW